MPGLGGRRFYRYWKEGSDVAGDALPKPDIFKSYRHGAGKAVAHQFDIIFLVGPSDFVWFTCGTRVPGVMIDMGALADRRTGKASQARGS